MQVPFDPAALGIGGLDRLGAGRAQVLDFLGQLASAARAEQRAGEGHVERRAEPDRDRPPEDAGDPDSHAQDVLDVITRPRRCPPADWRYQPAAGGPAGVEEEPVESRHQEHADARHRHSDCGDHGQPGELVEGIPLDGGRLQPRAAPLARRQARRWAGPRPGWYPVSCQVPDPAPVQPGKLGRRPHRRPGEQHPEVGGPPCARLPDREGQQLERGGDKPGKTGGQRAEQGRGE
jgi:hypothetical protein